MHFVRRLAVSCYIGTGALGRSFFQMTASYRPELFQFGPRSDAHLLACARLKVKTDVMLKVLIILAQVGKVHSSTGQVKHAAAESQHQVNGGSVRDAVVSKCTVLFHLLTTVNETLVVVGGSFGCRDLRLEVSETVSVGWNSKRRLLP